MEHRLLLWQSYAQGVAQWWQSQKIRSTTIGLSRKQEERYAHQLAMPGMNADKQEQLLKSTCLLIAGGEPLEHALVQLVIAGVGRINIAGSRDELKELAEIKNAGMNSDVIFGFHSFENASSFSETLVNEARLVMECSLDWQFKLHLSDICMRTRTPLIHCGFSGLRFQIFTMLPGKSACLRCALPAAGIDDYPLTPQPRNTFAPVAACAGSLLALEAIKVMAALGVTQGNEMWKVDGLSGEFEIIRSLDPRRDCPDCGRAGF